MSITPHIDTLNAIRSIKTGVNIRAYLDGRVQKVDIGDQRLSAPILLRWLVNLDLHARERAMNYARDAIDKDSGKPVEES